MLLPEYATFWFVSSMENASTSSSANSDRCRHFKLAAREDIQQLRLFAATVRRVGGGSQAGDGNEVATAFVTEQIPPASDAFGLSVSITSPSQRTRSTDQGDAGVVR